MQIFKSKIEKAQIYLVELGVKDIMHIKGESLYNHLLRVQKILERWGFDEIVQIGALFHSVYSTEYFKNKVLNIDNRNILQDKIGNESERLAYYFSVVDRESIRPLENQEYEIVNVYTKKKHRISEKDGQAIIHIMLANDIDHISLDNIGQSTFEYQKYEKLRNELCEKSQEELDTILLFENKDKNNEPNVRVRFIAHAGILIKSDDIAVVVDPWLYDSKRDKPIIEGFDPTQRTIDYLIPESKTSAKEISPDIVCLSHFHTHHSPLQEIANFLKIKPLVIICPQLNKNKLDLLQKKLGDYIYNRITFKFLENDEEFVVKNVKIKAFRHRDTLSHFMYSLTIENIHVMHIVDAEANKDTKLKVFDDSWGRVKALNPDYLFIGCVGHILKSIENGERVLIESATLSPVQAAKLAIIIKAKMVIPIGMYNHSVWDDRYEMGLNAGEAESQFYWALSYLAPSIKFRKAYPGDFLN